MTKNETPPIPAVLAPRTVFRSIPTRIRDLRETMVPPLVIEPAAEQSQAAVRQALRELGSKLAEIHRNAAEAYLSQSDYEGALPHLEAAVTFGPGEPELRMQLGFVRYLTGSDGGAIDAFNAVLMADGNNYEAWFNLGMVLFGQKQHAEAEDCFRRSTEIHPDDAQTWNNRGVCLWKTQRIADAKVCFQKALQIDPNDADAAFNLSCVR
ncbi:MAG TPA: tetratricopeptide repeat protein [Planctomycetota bacterium]